MDLPRNAFKHAISRGETQLGLWLTLANAYAAEAVAGAGFDWLLLDMEHSPSGLETVLQQLHAVSSYPSSAVIRPASNDGVLIKQVLDLGVQTLLIPFVQSREDAEAAVASIRYPPRGVRGVSATTRASGFGRVANYARRAEEELCLLLQVETTQALTDLEAIANVEGVDGVFFGPGDLAASMDHIGEPSHGEVKAAILDGIARVSAHRKPSGLLTTDAAFARACLEAGAAFVAVGVDTSLLARGADALLKQFRS